MAGLAHLEPSFASQRANLSDRAVVRDAESAGEFAKRRSDAAFFAESKERFEDASLPSRQRFEILGNARRGQKVFEVSLCSLG